MRHPFRRMFLVLKGLILGIQVLDPPVSEYRLEEIENSRFVCMPRTFSYLNALEPRAIGPSSPALGWIE